MGGKSGGGAGNYNNRISAFKVEDIGYGVPVKIGYGSNKVTPVLIWQRDFKAIEHENSGGGKGGGGSAGKTYTYTASILYALLEGPINSRKIGKVWRDKQKFDTAAKAQFSFYNRGSYPQTEWGYLTDHHATEALAYNGLVLVGATNYELSSSASLGVHTFEYFGRCLSNVGSDQNYLDAHIKDVITDFIGNSHYGAVDLSTTTLTLEMAAMHAYCVARGLLISPLVDNQQEAQAYISEWAKIANTGVVYSEGVLNFIPYSDSGYAGQFGSFSPDLTICATFDDSNLSEPIVPTRKKTADCFNKITVEVLNRGFDYNKTTREAKDQSSIENDGLRPSTDTLVLNSICIPRLGSIVAHTELLRGLYIRNTYQLKTSTDYDFLMAMDLIHITDEGLGLTNMRCRITQIDDDNSEESSLTITAEECPPGVSCG